MSRGSNWFDDPDLLVSELQRSRTGRTPAPSIAGYDDLREIGRGGQGTVYAAVQRSTRRTVAIKVFPESAVSGAARRRFEREIDLVASLKHPGIVRVYDSGVTEDGRPYLVMEFVQGEPIDEFRGGRGASRDLAQTIGLAAQVCDAVNYAHQRGVIHRDLKPSNIRIDGESRAHVLDFGLAKAIGVNPAQTTMPTVSRSGQFIGSVPWASPEQADGDASRVDVRSDVYSLGVILYQLVTGRFPYAVTGSLREALDNVVHAEPVRPSTVKAGINDELETVILKCLSKDAERRYQTAGDLARDLRAYLAGEPIQAKRDSAWYTIRKTLRRYQMAAGVAAAFVVLVTCALVLSVGLYREAASQRDKANKQSALATATRDFLSDTLKAADPDKDGPNVKVVDLLDRSAATVDTKFAGQDELRATMHSMLSELYEKLGNNAASEREAKLTMDIRAAGSDRRLALEAASAYWTTVHKSGRSREAEPEVRKVLDEQVRLFGADDADVITTECDGGLILRGAGKPKEAVEWYDRALASLKKTAPPDDPRILNVRERTATALDDLGQIDRAIEMDKEVLEARRRLNGPENSQTLTTMGNLAVSLLNRSRPAEAERLLREMLEVSKRKNGPDHADTLGVMNNLAKCLQDQGHLDEARQMFETTLAARVRLLGEEHPNTLVTMANVASIYGLLKQPERAEPLARKVLEIRTRTEGPDHLNTLISMNNLAGDLNDLGKPEEAEPLYRKAVEITDRTLPKGHYVNALFRMNLGNTLTTLKRYDEAEKCLLPSLDALTAALGPDNPSTRKARKHLARLYDAWGKPERAAAYRDPAPAPPQAAAGEEQHK